MLTRTATKAAALVGTSQPGISRLIAELERSTGLTLFNRERGRLEPTTEAQSFFEEVERRYAGLESLREFAVGLRNPESSVIRVGSVTTYSLGLFARTVAAFRKEEPSTKIALSVAPSETIRDQVASRTLSLGFVNGGVDVSDLDAELFCSTPAICAIPACHPLAKKKVVTIASLRDQPLIAYEPAAMVRWGIDSFFLNADLNRQVVAEVRYAVNICTMAKENVGIGLVHPVVAYDFLSSQDIVFRRFEHDVVFHSLRIKPTIPPPSPQLQKFISLSESILKETLDLLEDHL
ncbi:LysR family transcriptional regulator [Burkholderia aenigmatica]|uniref:LysR family transcriptional regulator n=4 Tax=Burkholderia TaxID=32008 RepID=A0A250LKR5_9BURK|nr:LysR family transcriptional regulator [Burkholderia contaminans]BBA45150.1 LysR family transcriptional regulator [Burkholderia contaminans]CAB3974255.1 LysR family transcriptional regulator [Burkholderia aenigmatica]